MKFKHSVLTAALAAAVGLGVAGQASASVYARSYLDINGLVLSIAPTAGASIDSFTFSSSNTAQLGGVGGANFDSCSGKPGVPGAGTNNCGAFGNPARGSNVLDAQVYNAPGGSPTQTNNAFSFQGPGANQYSFADSVVLTAQLAPNQAPAPSATKNLSESELQSGTTAAANAVIDSITGFTFSFATTNAGTLSLAFNAIQNMLAAVTGPEAAPNALASQNAILKVTNDNNPADFVLISPSGGVGDCVTVGASFTCGASIDPFSLNTNVGASSSGASNPLVNSGAFSFAANILGAGKYTLTFSQKTSTVVTRVPEPGVLALVGIGLLGMGWSSRRKTNV